MSLYASTTQVSADKSKAEIERILMRYGASGFAYANEPGRAMVMFHAEGRRIRFVLPLPLIAEFRYDKDAKGRDITWRERPKARQESTHQQAIRTKWRCLVLAIKSKLECVESGIETFEQAFLANILLANNETVGQAVIPRLAEACPNGHFLLEAGP